MFRIYNGLYLENFKIKKTKKGYKITVLNGFNDFIYCKNQKDLIKLYKISNEYCINRDKQNIIEYIENN